MGEQIARLVSPAHSLVRLSQLALPDPEVRLYMKARLRMCSGQLQPTRRIRDLGSHAVAQGIQRVECQCARRRCQRFFVPLLP
jgi:hypothetical protein